MASAGFPSTPRGFPWLATLTENKTRSVSSSLDRAQLVPSFAPTAAVLFPKYIITFKTGGEGKNTSISQASEAAGEAGSAAGDQHGRTSLFKAPPARPPSF